jgi:nitroreductase
LLSLLRGAMTAPDHGLMRPWRLIVLRGSARRLLGTALAQASGGDAEARARAAAKPLRAPLLVSIVFVPRPAPKVAEWEQLAATVAMVQNLILLLHVRHWGSIWRTGQVVDAEAVREVLRLEPHERLLGWLYIGTPDMSRPVVPRGDLVPTVAEMDDAGDIRSLTAECLVAGDSLLVGAAPLAAAPVGAAVHTPTLAGPASAGTAR